MYLAHESVSHSHVKKGLKQNTGPRQSGTSRIPSSQYQIILRFCSLYHFAEKDFRPARLMLIFTYMAGIIIVGSPLHIRLASFTTKVLQNSRMNKVQICLVQDLASFASEKNWPQVGLYLHVRRACFQYPNTDIRVFGQACSHYFWRKTQSATISHKKGRSQVVTTRCRLAAHRTLDLITS